MGRNVEDFRAGWDAEALERAAHEDAVRQAHREARRRIEAHPLHGTLDGIHADAIDRSEAPAYKMAVRDFGNGHREAFVARVVPDLQRTLEKAIERDVGARTARGEGDRDQSIQAATRRARQQVRLKCKAMAVNSLWTLTFRENVMDRELVLRMVAQFRRRVAALLGSDWRYLYVLERQQRGAWHVHLATHALPVKLTDKGVKVKSWDVMRRIWRSVAGELGGNFDEAKQRTRWGRKARVERRAGRIASYIAGYCAKDIAEAELNQRRFSCSHGVEVPEAYRAEWGDTVRLSELIELCYAGVGQRITRTYFDAEREVFFIESDDAAAYAVP